MASSNGIDETASSKSQDSIVMVGHERQAVVPIVPRLFEQELDQHVKNVKMNEHALAASKIEGCSDDVDAKVQDAVVDEAAEVNEPCNPDVEAKKHGISFTVPESSPLESKSVQISEFDDLSEDESRLDTPTQGYSSLAWHSDQLDPMMRIFQGTSLHDEDPRTACDQDVGQLLDPSDAHDLSLFLDSYSPHYTSLNESHAAAQTPSPPAFGSQAKSESAYSLPEPYRYPMNALNFDISHNQQALDPLDSSHISPNTFEPFITPSTTPSDYQFEKMTQLNGLSQSAAVNGMDPHMQSLVQHLSQQIDNPTSADCILEINVGGEVTYTKAHAVIIGQSSVLQAMMTSASTFPGTNMKHIVLRTSNEFGSNAAFDAALRVLYGESPVVAFNDLLEGTTNASVTPLDTAIAFMFAGHTVDSPHVQSVGLQAIMANRSFDGLSKLYAFALSGNANWTMPLPMAWLKNVPAALFIIFGVFRFMLRNFPNPFKLDIKVPSVIELGAPRYHPGYSPLAPLSTASKMLASISFGDFPHKNDPTISKESTIVSGILLSLSDLDLSRFAQMANGLINPKIILKVEDQRAIRFGVVG